MEVNGVNYDHIDIEKLKYRVEHSKGIVLTQDEIFIQVPNSFIRNPDLTISEKMIYLYLWGYGIDSGQAFPSHNKISKDLGISKPTIIKIIDSLEKKDGLLVLNRFYEKKNNEKTTNLYCLCKINNKDGSFEKSYLDVLKVIYPDKKIML